MVEAAELAARPPGKARRRVSLREIHGIVFGTMGKPTRVLVPGYTGSTPEQFAGWLDELRAQGWEVNLTPALSFEGVLVDARCVAAR